MQHVWSVLCKKSIIDPDENLISLIDCIERLTITASGDVQNLKNMPAVSLPVQLELVSYWILDEKIKKSPSAIVEIYDPLKKKLGTAELNLTVKKGSNGVRNILKLPNLVVTTSGTYNFIVKYKDEKISSFKEIARLPLQLKLELKSAKR